MNARAWAAALVLATAPGGAAGQALADRVAETRDGIVRIGFAVRVGVEICRQGIRMRSERMWWRGSAYRDRTDWCHDGPLRVELRVRDGVVRGVETLRGGDEGTASARDLGLVPAPEAARFLLGVARRGGSGRGVDDAVLPAVLADAGDIWPEVLDLAKDRDVARDVRRSALFWVGQEAAAEATEGLADVARDDDEDQDVRDAAVFALSQRPAEEGIPVLMELARTAREPRTRRTAFFWLAQSDDPRVLAFFEEVLLGRGGE